MQERLAGIAELASMDSGDIHFPVVLTLEEVCQGTERSVTYPGPRTLCIRCHGAREQSGVACVLCAGTGWSSYPRRVSFTIPPGARDQTQIRVRGFGRRSSETGKWGSLRLVCCVRPHPNFRREGADLITEAAPLEDPDAVLRIDTPYGAVIVPSAAQHRSEVRLEGYGCPVAVGAAECGTLTVRFSPKLSRHVRCEYERALSDAAGRLRNGDPDGAIRVLSIPDFADLIDSRALAVLGRAEYAQGDYEAARTLFILAVKLDPAKASGWVDLGRFALAKAEAFGACVCFELALERGMATPQVRTWLRQAVRLMFEQAVGQRPGAAGVSGAAAEARHLAEHRMYAAAAQVLRRQPGWDVL